MLLFVYGFYRHHTYKACIFAYLRIEYRLDRFTIQGDLTISREEEVRINDAIRAPRVRLIDEEGEMLGIMPARAALEKALEAGLDLVEISPNADPPVCKILDYGKFRYQEQKKRAEARKKQKVIEIKELKLRPVIDDHDLAVKLKAANRFLDDGDKVKFTLRFRGREMAHQDLGLKLLNRVKEALADKIKVEQEPKSEGRQIIMVVGPAPATKGTTSQS